MENSKSEKDCFAHEDDYSYDAVVIGSGYGGSVAAYRMSMAGLRVCLLEKGRKWEAQDFPTNTIQMLSAVRMENRTLRVSFGPRDALYQLYTQDDSLAAMACGLGGGSLVNAAVLVPAPVRTRRNPKWPKDWESDWELCQASASAMLRAQMVPIKFKNANVMEIVGEESGLLSQNPVKLGINFDLEDQMSDSERFQKTDSCQACGNCLSGCPYNSKNSTDKNYLVSAIQAGCTVKTECEVQYVVRNPDESGAVGEAKSEKKGRSRRWLVYLNDFDYVLSDFVVVSGGVFGTAQLLFRSQERGLQLSKKLGFGLSCNGNNVAYLAESTAPLNAHGIDRKKLSEVPFHERPGPSISSSYISSLGFTIQSAVIPAAFPSILFKGITTYEWPIGYNFLHGILHKVKHLLKQRGQDMVLNVMGHDNSDGKITFLRDTNEICFQPPSDPLLPQKVAAFHKLTKKFGGILFMSRYRSTSVHLLGGCCASSDASSGVCNNNGQVFDQLSPTTVHPGLYVCDASLIPCSVGINPSLTIATAAEHVSKHLVQDAFDYKGEDAVSKSRMFDEKLGAISSWKLESSQRSALVFKETMRGNVGGLPCIAYLKIKLNLKAHFDERTTEGKSISYLAGKVGGYIICTALEMDKLHVIDGEVDLCQVDLKTPYTQYMHYRLLLAAPSGSRYIFEGKKVMNPFLFASYAWKESTTLHVVLRKITNNSGDAMSLKGKLHISMLDLLKSVISLSGSKRTKFLHLLLQSLYRTYISQVPRGSLKGFNPSDLYQSSYPVSIIHEIKAEDGVTISCQQWKCNQGPQSQRHGEGRNPYPVLLINGYCVESYCLPTESNDLVRTLLQEGHETWLLQSRLHPETSINSLTIEDIGRFDVPAAVDKILKLHGDSARIHVIGHCIGGLAMHIALMGGHVSSKKIASLSCSNSSMFFKLTAWSKVKLWLPLIPMSMAILGQDKSLPMFQTSKASPRQQLLKSIARAIPRYERCSCDECEVFSGIFGNSFWHQNISHEMHHWVNKVRLPRLPMGAFPHLRKICNAGFIVNAKGRNCYLIHPERMGLPTLYLSGGRTLLVTPHTSFLANKYMKLHQPGYRHERVVVDGFGHLDLLIGEESSKKVFPHILSHMALAEKENAPSFDTNERQYGRDALSWADDPYEDAEGGFWGCLSPLLINFFFLVLLFSIGFRLFLNFSLY